MGRRKQPLPELSPIHIEATSADESEEPNLSIIMDLLVGINTWLTSHDQCLDDLTSEKEEQEEQSPTQARADPSTSRGASRRGMTTGPGHANHHPICHLADAARARVASCIKGSNNPVFFTTDDDSG